MNRVKDIRVFWAINFVGFAIGWVAAFLMAGTLPPDRPLLGLVLGGLTPLAGLIVAAMIQFRTVYR